jgi:beta-galactosidase
MSEWKKAFPVSVWYGIGHVTPEFSVDVWERDIKLIKEAGFKFIRGWINWSAVESKPGEYNFEKVDRMLSIASKEDMKVIFQVYIEFAPDWLVKEYPDAIFVSESDHKVFPQGSPGLCLDHPDVMRRAEEFLTRLALHLKDNPSFYAWDVWSEPQLVQWAYYPHVRPGIFCYCPHSIRKFRQWMKDKYGDIEHVNRAWHRSFSNLDDITPPKYLVLHFATENLDWLSFNIYKLREYLKWRVQTIRKAGDKHIISSHAPIPSPFLNPLHGFPDDWEMAKEVDVWGTSLYPKHAHHVHDPATIAFILDITRCASEAYNKAYWIGEMQGGHGVGGLNLIEPVKAEDITIWSWSAVAHGAKGINYYHWYPMMWGYEATGYGLTEPDGSLNERSKAAGKFAETISNNEEIFTGLKPIPSEVAILYNVQAYKALWIANTTEVNVLNKSIMGLYRIFYEENIPVDIIHNENIINGDVEKYKVIYLPFSYILSDKLCQGIIKYVKKGGRVVADARLGWIKDDGWVDKEIPALGMDKLFKVRELYCKNANKTQMTIVTRNAELPFLDVGDIICGTLYQQGFHVFDDGEVLAKHSEDGVPAIVYGENENGKTFIVGTNIGKGYEDLRDVNLKRLVLGFSKDVRRKINVYGVPKNSIVEARVLENKKNDKINVLILINHSNEFIAPVVNILDRNIGKARDLITGKELSAIPHESGLELTLKMEPKQVIVALIE